jgi:hypothetical protein
VLADVKGGHLWLPGLFRIVTHLGHAPRAWPNHKNDRPLTLEVPSCYLLASQVFPRGVNYARRPSGSQASGDFRW